MRFKTRSGEPPKLLLTPEALGHLQAYARAAEGEVSGFGKVVRGCDGELGELVVAEIVLLPQEGDCAGTTIGEETVAGFLNILLDRGENPGNWRCWWHSHGTYSVFWSSQDEETCATLGHDWMVSIVTNRAGDLLARIDFYRPVHVAVPLRVGTYVVLAEPELQALEEEVREKVRYPERPASSWWPGYDQDWDDDTEVDRDNRCYRGCRKW